MSMAGRKRKPVELHIHDPKKHIGKEEMRGREEAEVTLGEFKFSPEAEVKKNKRAYAKWKEIVDIYKAAEEQIGNYLSNTDNWILSRYCIHYVEYLDLVKKREKLEVIEVPEFDEIDHILDTKEEYAQAKANFVVGLSEFGAAVKPLLKVHSALNAKNKEITALEDRIFLNPAAKVRTLPIKRKAKKQTPVDRGGFDV